MNEVKGDLWDFKADLRCITTNGFVKKNGRAVMGRGCAREAVVRYPGIDLTLGELLTTYGNHVHELGWTEAAPGGKTRHLAFDLLSFPVKHHWMRPADLKLIERSAKELVHFLDSVDSTYESDHTVVVPRPGCGNGQLSWEQVKPVIEPYFDERFYVISYE
jgi:hypothetical protein